MDLAGLLLHSLILSLISQFYIMLTFHPHADRNHGDIKSPANVLSLPQVSGRESICKALSHYAEKSRTLDKSVYKVVA